MRAPDHRRKRTARRAAADAQRYEDRRGVRPVSWEEMHGIVEALALAVAPRRPELVVPVGRGGFYPGTLIAHLLQIEPHPEYVDALRRQSVQMDTAGLVAAPPVELARSPASADDPATGEATGEDAP